MAVAEEIARPGERPWRRNGAEVRHRGRKAVVDFCDLERSARGLDQQIGCAVAEKIARAPCRGQGGQAGDAVKLATPFRTSPTSIVPPGFSTKNWLAQA